MVENTEDLSQEPSAKLAAFVADLSFEDIPATAIETVERCFADTVGVALAGASEGAGKRAVEMAATIFDGDIPLFGTTHTTSVMAAAFANSTAAHTLDFDDDQFEITSHPSTTMVPPILALAVTEDVCDGTAAITAYTAGFETQYYLSQAITPSHYEIGWHATSTFGTFGATAAASSLLDLSKSETRHALNIAASTPAGVCRNFGTMAKPMHAGQAARSGVTAALLAARGFTAASDAISGPSGFFDLYSSDANVSLNDLPTLGEYWALVENGVYVKKYPCCYAMHNAIAAVEELIETKDLLPKDITSVWVVVSPGAAKMLTYPNPESGIEAKFSLQYCIASAFTSESVSLETFDDGSIDNPTRQTLRERIEMVIDTDIPYTDTRANIKLETEDGETHQMYHADTPGSPANPLSETELRRKFEQCIMYSSSDINGGDVFNALRNLRETDIIALADRL